MRHEDAWRRLPDLLEDRDDSELLGHVRDCPDCQRQLFRLGRVDRMLRDQATPRTKRPRIRPVAGAALAVAAVAAALLFLLGLHSPNTHGFTLRMTSGEIVGNAVMSHPDAQNVSLMLTARGLPLNRQHVFVLWAGDGGSSMQVGHFMVDRNGRCHVRFNLPATHAWRRFWVAQPGNASAVVAST